jgi:hypothetical protein
MIDSGKIQMTHKFNVAFVDEIPFNERSHFGVFFPSVKSWSRRQTKTQVSGTGFSQCPLSSLIVKNVVNQL